MTALHPLHAWRAGLRAFGRAPERLLLPVLIGTLAWVVTEVAVQAAIGHWVTPSVACVRQIAGIADPTRCPAGTGAADRGLVLGVLALTFLAQLFWAAQLHAALRTLGHPRPVRPLAVAVVALLDAVLITLGIALGVLPGLVIAVVVQLTVIGVVAEGRGPLSSFAAGIGLAVRHPLATLGLTVLALAGYAVGALLLVVGVLPATAVAVLTQLAFHPATAAVVTGAEEQPG